MWIYYVIMSLPRVDPKPQPNKPPEWWDQDEEWEEED